VQMYGVVPQTKKRELNVEADGTYSLSLPHARPSVYILLFS